MKSICNFGYARTKKGGTHFPDVRGLLKYVQYRDDRDDHIPGGGGPDRWVDGGLGGSYPRILARLDELSAGNPHARFMEAIKASMAEWQTWRDEHDKPLAGPIEYSFVVHRPERNYGEQMHAHLILPAATENAMNGDLAPLYNNRPQVDAFKEIVYRQLDRVYDLDRERELPDVELQVAARWFSGRDRAEIPFHERAQSQEDG